MDPIWFNSEWCVNSDLELVYAIKEQIKLWLLREKTKHAQKAKHAQQKEGNPHENYLLLVFIWAVKQEQKQSHLIVFRSISVLYFHISMKEKEKNIVPDIPFDFHTDLLCKCFSS